MLVGLQIWTGAFNQGCSQLKNKSGAAIMKYYSLGGLTKVNLTSHIFGGYKCQIKVSARLVSSKGCDEKICSRLISLACRQSSSPCVFPLDISEVYYQGFSVAAPQNYYVYPTLGLGVLVPSTKSSTGKDGYEETLSGWDISYP